MCVFEREKTGETNIERVSMCASLSVRVCVCAQPDLTCLTDNKRKADGKNHTHLAARLNFPEQA